MSKEKQLALGIDIGGTNTAIGVVDEAGNPVGHVNPDGTVTTRQVIGQRGSTSRLAVDENGNVIGYIDENGNVVDFNGNVIGQVDANGNVVDKNGNIIGKATDDFVDLAIGEDGKVVGYIDESGLVNGVDGNIIGYVDEDGNIVGNLAQKSIIGNLSIKSSYLKICE